MSVKTQDSDGGEVFFDVEGAGSEIDPAKAKMVMVYANLSHAVIDISDTDEHELVPAPGAGQRIRIFAFEFSSLVNVELTVKSASTTIRIYRGSSVSGPPYPLNLADNAALNIQATTSDPIKGGVSYAVEDV